MDVELDVFSGRPNPEWRLSESDATTFLRKVAALPGASTGQLSGDLGYRGFVIRVSDGTVAVQNGTVRSARGGTTAYRQDPNRDLERWLLGTGHQVLDREVLTLVEGELPP